MNYKHNIEACSCNHCCHKKQEVLHILSAWLVAFLTIPYFSKQIARNMRHY